MRLPPGSEGEELRDLLLWMVYLDEWRFYRPHFPVEKLKEGMQSCRRLSQLIDWIKREGAVFAN